MVDRDKLDSELQHVTYVGSKGTQIEWEIYV